MTSISAFRNATSRARTVPKAVVSARTFAGDWLREPGARDPASRTVRVKRTRRSAAYAPFWNPTGPVRAMLPATAGRATSRPAPRPGYLPLPAPG